MPPIPDDLPQEASASPALDRARRAAEALHARSGDAVDIARLADALAISRRQLERDFRRSFGQGLAAFARRLREQRAAWLVVNSCEAFAQVALEAGYADQAQFSRAVRRACGCTPGALRQARAGAAATETS